MDRVFGLISVGLLAFVADLTRPHTSQTSTNHRKRKCGMCRFGSACRRSDRVPVFWYKSNVICRQRLRRIYMLVGTLSGVCRTAISREWLLVECMAGPMRMY